MTSYLHWRRKESYLPDGRVDQTDGLLVPRTKPRSPGQEPSLLAELTVYFVRESKVKKYVDFFLNIELVHWFKFSVFFKLWHLGSYTV